MDRATYNSCMKPYMTGGGKDRKERFCRGAKICSGKASSEEEADRLCAVEAVEKKDKPKQPRQQRDRKVCTLRDLDAISTCLTENIDLSSLTTDNIHDVFNDALKKCSGVKATKRITSAKKALSTMDPKQIEALETIAKLSKQFEGKQW